MAQDPVSVVRKLMYRRLRITLTDGRVLFGDFQCFDKQGMIILGEIGLQASYKDSNSMHYPLSRRKYV